MAATTSTSAQEKTTLLKVILFIVQFNHVYYDKLLQFHVKIAKSHIKPLSEILIRNKCKDGGRSINLHDTHNSDKILLIS